MDKPGYAVSKLGHRKAHVQSFSRQILFKTQRLTLSDRLADGHADRPSIYWLSSILLILTLANHFDTLRHPGINEA